MRVEGRRRKRIGAKGRSIRGWGGVGTEGSGQVCRSANRSIDGRCRSAGPSGVATGVGRLPRRTRCVRGKRRDGNDRAERTRGRICEWRRAPPPGQGVTANGPSKRGVVGRHQPRPRWRVREQSAGVGGDPHQSGSPTEPLRMLPQYVGVARSQSTECCGCFTHSSKNGDNSRGYRGFRLCACPQRRPKHHRVCAEAVAGRRGHYWSWWCAWTSCRLLFEAGRLRAPYQTNVEHPDFWPKFLCPSRPQHFHRRRRRRIALAVRPESSRGSASDR